MKKTGTIYSWKITSEKEASKICDKSFFEHNETGIPLDVVWFFNAEDMQPGEKRFIIIHYSGKEYDAVIRRGVDKVGRYRLIWGAKLGKKFNEFNKLHYHPEVIIKKEGADVFTFSFGESKLVSSIPDAKWLSKDNRPSTSNLFIENTDIVEGARKQITINSYERDPKAKKECREFYLRRDGKIVCQICGFDFGEKYGPEFENSIHFHHIKPLNEIGENYIVIPEKDLIPVCPNCHYVLHLYDGISVEELKNKLK